MIPRIFCLLLILAASTVHSTVITGADLLSMEGSGALDAWNSSDNLIKLSVECLSSRLRKV